MLFLFLCFCSNANSQDNAHYKLSVFGTRNGLLSPKIYALTQSSDHHLWIGTEIGASRYNGYEFQNIQYTSAQEQIGKIVAIAEDSSGGVWLGGEGGLFYFFNEEIVRCILVKSYAAAVESLVVDKEGNLWIGEMYGLYKLTGHEIRQWYNKKNLLQLKPYGGSNQRIICLDTDKEGNIYYGSFNGVFFLKKGETKATLRWTNPAPNNPIRCLTALSPDSIYFNHYGGESISVINSVERHYRETNSVGQRFFKKHKSIYRLTTASVENHQAGNFVPFINFGQQTNFVYDALLDEEGNFWLGTWEGLFKYRYTPFSVFHRADKAHPEAFSFLETKEGQLLFGGNRGIIEEKVENKMQQSQGIKRFFHLAEVLALYQHDDGSLWAGSGYEGITRFRNGSYTNYNETNGLPDNHCNTFYRVGDHTVFACTEKGVVVLDPLAQNPLKAHYDFVSAYNRQPKLLGVFEPEQGVFFFYSNGGLFRLVNGKLQNEKLQGLAAENIYITKMGSDKKGRVWLATQGKGLLLCSYSKNGFVLQRQYTKKNGLLSDELLSLLVDKNDRLWIAGYTSVSLLQEESGRISFINFTEQDGLPADYYQHLHLKQQRDGTIWALTSMNLFSFHSDSIRLNKIAPQLSLNQVTIDKDEKNLAQHNGTLQLAHNQNSLSLSFTAVSLSNPAAIKYAYRLLPNDTSWIETKERRLYFSSLTPGMYVVEIKASNNAGVWSAPLQYSFKIRPPFWNAWWFYALLGLIATAIVYWLFKRRINAVKSKAIIRQQLTELESKALRAQMNPHFIFNSLNAIQELIVTQNVEAAYDYLSKFSKLLRLVLNHSEKPSIPLADEIVMLHLYLELETLRFRKSFSYDIVVEESFDTEAVLVPPLLLQPFIENAIWHGLMLKDGEKKLHVSIKQNEGSILCVIEDNGIGRKRSAEIKAQKIGASHFESKGLKLSQHRIYLLEKEGKKGTVEIEDIYETELACGTRVTIQLPLIHR